jgi:hypothetical protein
MRMIEDFLAGDLHDRLFALLGKGRPERNDGHDDGFEFDDAREFDRIFDASLRAIFSRMHRARVFPKATKRPIALGCTMIGYHVDDFIRRHKDSYLLAGDTIATVSLGSPTVLDFYEDGTERHVRVLVPPKSLYVMSGEVRSAWTHEIKPGHPEWQGQTLARSRRFALVFFEPGPAYRGENLKFP